MTESRKVYGLVAAGVCLLLALVAAMLHELAERKGAGPSALHQAAREGDVEAVRALLGKGQDVDSRTEDGATPLHEAAIGGHVEVVELLLTSGAEANATKDSGATPLYFAELKGQTRVAEILRERGATT